MGNTDIAFELIPEPALNELNIFKTLLLKLPHKPLSEPIITTSTFFTSLSKKSSLVTEFERLKRISFSLFEYGLSCKTLS